MICVILGAAIGWLVKFTKVWQAQKEMSALTLKTQAKYQPEPETIAFAAYAGSDSCQECHAAAFAKWQGSHHGLAERKVEAKLDGPAFEPAKEIKAGTQVSEATKDAAGKFTLVTDGLKGPKESFSPERVIGVDPLRQFLVAAPGGRFQATELAWDPHKQEWFDVYGQEDRRPGEWGHWTGRGMTWNQMCASCHNTRVRKNYDVSTDSYRTAMAEMTVGCEACHGPMRAHADWQKNRRQRVAEPDKPFTEPAPPKDDPTVARLSRDQMLDTCGMCHARRGELTGNFVPGGKFGDHFALSIPDETDLFYADGQVHDEDYEYTSFLSSKMHTAGVRCMDCHDAHSNQNLVEGNALCLRCHGSATSPVPGVAVAPPIVDPDHSFHRAGTPGSRCVDCHMPVTTYMQRHERRDHGFTIPDPLLTKQHNIPNACNRCHADKDADWALAACNKWYGEKMNRPTRTRAQWVAEARTGTPGAAQHLVKLLAEEKSPLWRAVAVNLLRGSLGEAEALHAVSGATKDPSELVRSMAARAIGSILPSGGSGSPNQAMAPPTGPGSTELKALLADPVRGVRIDAAWALRRSLDPESHAGSELLYSLNFNRDQPIGLTQWATWLEDRGDQAGALAAFGKAVEWDHGSAALYSNYALALSVAGQPAEAAKQLAEAVRVAPKDAQMRYSYALALNEVNRAADARAELEEAVKLEPRFARAWYNLGLARNAADEPGPALEALARAEHLDPQNAEAPYAAATILARLQRIPEAAAAAQRALRIDPNYGDAANLLRKLRAPGG